MEAVDVIVATGTTMTVKFPADLFEEIKRIAAEENWPESKAVILLARLGAKAQREAERSLQASHEAFISESERESDPQKQQKRGDDLIRAIFGREAIG
jgi:hypothetical protein